MTLMSLQMYAQKTTPLYGDTVSVIKNFKVGYYSYLTNSYYRHSNQYLSIDSTTGKIIIVPIPASYTVAAGNGLFTRNDSVLLGVNPITEDVTLDAQTNQKDIGITAKKFILNGTKTSGTGSANSIYGEVNNPGGNALEINATNTNIGGAHSTGLYLSGTTTSSGIYSFGMLLDPGTGGIGITTSAGGASDTTLFTKDSSGHIHHLDKTDFKNKFQIASSHSQTIFVPATTDTVMILSTVTNIIAPPTTIGTLYLSLAPSPIDGTFITAKFSEQINTANWIVTDGSTVKGLNNGGLILAGIEIKLYYDLATTTWY